MTNRLKPVKVRESVVSIALRIQKMADDEIPVNFIHEIKTKLWRKLYLRARVIWVHEQCGFSSCCSTRSYTLLLPWISRLTCSQVKSCVDPFLTCSRVKSCVGPLFMIEHPTVALEFGFTVFRVEYWHSLEQEARSSQLLMLAGETSV